MNIQLIFGVSAIILALGSGVLMYIYFFKGQNDTPLKSMMRSTGAGSSQTVNGSRPGQKANLSDQEVDHIKEEARKRSNKGKQLETLESKLFQAGLYSEDDKKEFNRIRVLLPFFVIPMLTIPVWWVSGPMMGVCALVLSVLAAIQLPVTWLDKKIQRRNEEILYYLPIVIEQVTIGVSSSLDVGPCLQRIVAMADERDTHNPVTELVRYALFYIKSGVSFEEAMVETGKASGQTELKHAFMFLAQVAKHGGEITKQLQELANAVSKQREAFIDGRIKKLELVATGPLTLVFAGFLAILLSGLFIEITKAF